MCMAEFVFVIGLKRAENDTLTVCPDKYHDINDLSGQMP